MNAKCVLGVLVAIFWLGCSEKPSKETESEPTSEPEARTDKDPEPEEAPEAESKPPAKTVLPFIARSRMNKDLQRMKQVALALRMYAVDNDGSYPESLEGILSLVEQEASWLDVKDEEASESARILYVKGLTDASSAELPLLVHPFVINGKRVVIYCDGRGIPEDAVTFKMPESLMNEK